MTRYEITFVWPNDDWTWIYREAKDFHTAMLIALMELPVECRVKSIVRSNHA
jgi:hypothetical protein